MVFSQEDHSLGFALSREAKGIMQETKKGVMPVLRSSEVRRIEPISVEEIHKAQKEVLKCVQRQSFEEEISCLDDKGGEIDGIGSRSNLVKKLQIKMPSSIYKLDPIAPITNAPINSAKETPCYEVDCMLLPPKVGAFRLGACAIPDSRKVLDPKG